MKRVLKWHRFAGGVRAFSPSSGREYTIRRDLRDDSPGRHAYSAWLWLEGIELDWGVGYRRAHDVCEEYEAACVRLAGGQS